MCQFEKIVGNILRYIYYIIYNQDDYFDLINTKINSVFSCIKMSISTQPTTNNVEYIDYCSLIISRQLYQHKRHTLHQQQQNTPNTNIKKIDYLHADHTKTPEKLELSKPALFVYKGKIPIRVLKINFALKKFEPKKMWIQTLGTPGVFRGFTKNQGEKKRKDQTNCETNEFLDKVEWIRTSHQDHVMLIWWKLPETHFVESLLVSVSFSF